MNPTHLCLFSGIGGFSIAAQRVGFETIAFCEKEPYAQKILIQNFGAILADSDAEREQQSKRVVQKERRRTGDICEEKAMADTICERSSNLSRQKNISSTERHIQENKQVVGQSVRSETERCRPIIHHDIFNLDGKQYRGVSLVTGGFPCQPFSQAGKRRGKEDNRHIWPEMLRVIDESRPRFILAENVAGIISMELDSVLSDLENIGYTARPIVIPACAVDARHRRDRVWIIGYSKHDGQSAAEITGSLESRNDGQQERSKQAGEHSRSGEQLASVADASHNLPHRSGITRNRVGQSSNSGGNASDARGVGLQRKRQARVEKPSFDGSQAIPECDNGDAAMWPVEPAIRGMVDELSERLDIDEEMISHYLMGYEAKKTRPEKAMPELQRTAGAQTIWGNTGGSGCVSETDLLQSAMYGGSLPVDFAIKLLSEKIPQIQLRKMWDSAVVACASCGRKSSQQQSNKSANAMRELPSKASLAKREIASCLLLRVWEGCESLGFMRNTSDQIETVWQSISEAERDWCWNSAFLGTFHAEWPGVPRVINRIPNRVHRLKALGNAIVPQVAEIILREIYKQIIGV